MAPGKKQLLFFFFGRGTVGLATRSRFFRTVSDADPPAARDDCSGRVYRLFGRAHRDSLGKQMPEGQK
jgi:hypothetical protein